MKMTLAYRRRWCRLTIHSYIYIRFIRQLGRVLLSFQCVYRLRFAIPSSRWLYIRNFFFKPFLWWKYATIVFCIVLFHAWWWCVLGRIILMCVLCFMCVSVPMSNNQNQQDDTSIVENQKLSTQVIYNIYCIINI